MKKKNKKNQIRKRFSTLLLCCLAIVLCTAPALHADETVIADQTKIIDYPVTGFLWIFGTANLQPGASAQYIYVQDGGTLNMYSGTIGEKCFISVSPTKAGMTVYGTGFAVSNGTIEPEGYWNPNGIGTLTGYYEDTSPINLMFYCDTPINLQPPPSSGPEEIKIDIKPGGNHNSINLKSWGVVPVAVLTTSDFNADTIDPTTVEFAGASPLRWTLRWKMMKDVDDDGDKDRVFFFKTQDLDLDENSTEATLTGKTTNGEVISGTDEVRIVPRKKYYKKGRCIVPSKKYYKQGRYSRARSGRHRTTEGIE